MSDQSAFSSWEAAVQWLREQPDRCDLVEAGYYDDPLSAAAARYWSSGEWQSIRPLLGNRRGRVLDVGAGRGIASYALAREGFADVTALEPDGSELVGAGAIRRLAAETGLQICVTQEVTERLPFDDGSFDVVFARAVLHHTKDLQGACREFFRVLRPGGRLVAVREHVISRAQDLPVFLDIHPLHRLYGGENALLRSQYEAAIDTAGFMHRQTLAPFDSPVNFAPHTAATLQREIGQRVAGGVPGVGAMVAALLRLPPVWMLARLALNAVDHRPGRLYSFVAERP